MLRALSLLCVPCVLLAAPAPVTSLAYHPNGQWLVAGLHGQAVVVEVAKGSVRLEIPQQTGRVTAAAFAKDGRWLALASGDPGKSGIIRVYEVEPKGPTFTLKATLEGHKDVLYALAFRPDGQQLASAGYDRVIKQWDIATWKPTSELKDHSDTVYGLAYHPESKWLASAGADRAVKVWDVASGKRLYTLSDATDWVYAVTWHPDGKHLAAAGVDKSIRVWKADAEGGKLVHSVFAHQEPVTKLLYDATGNVLYSASEGKHLKRWDTTKMVEQFVFPAQTETLLAHALRPDGKQLAVGRFDGVVQLLDTTNGKVTSAPLPVTPKPPALNKFMPNAAPRGQTVAVTVDGQFLDGATYNAVGVTLEPTPTGFKITVPKDAPVGILPITAKNAAGTSLPLNFIVDRFAVTVDGTGIDATKTGQRITLPTTIAGKMTRAGETDHFRFDATAGQEVGVQVLASVLGSKMEPVLELTDADGVVLAESTTGLLGYTCPKAGTYAISVRDHEFRGGSDQFYRLHIGPIPIVTSVLPLGVQRGHNATVQLTGVHLPIKSVSVRIPADAVLGSRTPLRFTGEMPLGETSVIVGEFPEVLASTGNVPVPGTANGILTQAEQKLSFHAKKGQRLLLEVNARRSGSPLDSMLDVLDAQGQPVERHTLRCTARVFVTFRDHDSEKPGIRLESWNELNINDYLYVGNEVVKIKQLPLNPDADCNFYAVDGKRSGFFDTTPGHHAMGAPMYKIELHPPGRIFPSNGMPTFKLHYRNDDGGPGYGKDSRLFFDVPADGEYHVRLRDTRGLRGPTFAYRLTVRAPRPDFAISVPTIPAVVKGGAVPINFNVSRRDGYDGPIRVQFANLPAGWDAPPTVIEAGEQTTSTALFAPADATLPADTPPLKLIARATIDGQEIVHEVSVTKPTLAATGDITTTTNVSEVTIKPGHETRLVVKIERRNGFAGRVPVDVRGLPHGVRVLDIGLNGILITPNTTEREIVIYAEPWVKPTDMPFVVFARREGKNTEHAAKSVLLKVR